MIASTTLYRCLDKLTAHKQEFFSFLRARWTTLFNARFDILLYDLTSTYFESDPPFEDKRQFGHSRDKRRDCVQVVIALVVTPDGFPLAYEVMAGNTSDNTTLADFLTKIENQYGRSDRVWIMDRGIPTEQTPEAMREGDTPVRYLVGTPKGRLTRRLQSRPSNNASNCARERRITRSCSAGPAKRLCSRRFHASTRPVPSHHRTYTRSMRLGRNITATPEYGSRPSSCSTTPTRAPDRQVLYGNPPDVWPPPPPPPAPMFPRRSSKPPQRRRDLRDPPTADIAVQTHRHSARLDRDRRNRSWAPGAVHLQRGERRLRLRLDHHRLRR